MKASENLEPVLERLRALLPDLQELYAVDTLEVFGSRVPPHSAEVLVDQERGSGIPDRS